VRPLLTNAAVIETLDLVMTPHCQVNHKIWDRSKGPFHHRLIDQAEINLDDVTPGSHWWYHCPGACHYINAWAGLLGSMLQPKLHWYVFCLPTYHTATVGYRRFPEEPSLLMDLAWYYKPGIAHPGTLTMTKIFDHGEPRINRLSDYLDAFRKVLVKSA
jgi:hypothetical protein